MKKLLLLVAVAVMSTLGVHAQWAEPQLPTTGSDLISGGKYMIKNVAAAEVNEDACFLTGGIAWYTWATSTALTSQAEALTFTITETEQGWTLQRTSDNKYTFISGHSPQGLANTGEMHVDQGSQAADLHFFDFKKVGNYYRIYAAKANTAFNIPVYADSASVEPLLFWGWKLDNDELNEENPYGPYQTAVYASVDPAQGFGCDWELIYTSAYEARKALYALYDEAVEYDVDLTAATKVYNDANATAAEIEAMTAQLKLDIIDAKFANASEDEPMDATELLKNPDFAAGNINGWVCTFEKGVTAQNIGYQSNKEYPGKAWEDEETGESGTAILSKFIEAWSPNTDAYKFEGRSFGTIGDGKLYQTMENLPAGKYKLSADVNAVQQNNSAANPVTGVQLYVTAGEFEAHMDMATGNGQPEHFILTFIHTGGDAEMGLRTSNTTANWIGADNFTLRYYGPVTKNPYLIVLEDLIAQCEKKFGEDDIHAQTTLIEAYNEAMNEAKAASGEDQAYIDAKDKLEAAANALSKSVAEYASLLKNIESAQARVEELDGTEWTDLAAELADLVDELVEHYESGDLNAEETSTVGADIEQMISDYVSENLQPGNDVTILLKNPGFTSDFSGWTNTGAAIDWQKNHGNGENLLSVNVERPEDEDGLAEKWHAAFTLSQTIKNLPAGLYELTCQGFNRHDDGVNDQFAELYAVLPDGSEQIAHFADINDYATDEMLYEKEEGDDHWRSDAETEIDGETKYIPNSMTGAAWHFMNKSNGEDYDYISKFSIVLTEMGDLTVGARCTDTHQWVIFDNFRIVYKGTGGGIYAQPIMDLQKEIEGYTDKVTTPMITEIEDAVSTGDKAIDAGDDETCIAAIETLREAIARAIENMNLQKAVQSHYDQLNGDTYNKLQEIDDDALTDQFNKLIDVIDNEEYTEMTNEEMKQYGEDADAFVKTVDDAYVAWQQEQFYAEVAEAVDGASDDAPASLTDFLANPDLENEGSTRGQDPEGWTLDLTQYTNRGYQDNKVYTGAAIELNGEEYTPTCEHFIEVWKSGGEAILGDIYQKIMLPAGTYKLSADVITTNGDQIEGCYLYAGESHMVVRSDEANTPKHYELIFKVAEDRTVVQIGINCSSTSNASWLGADNFTLTAYGKNSKMEENGEENAINSIAADAQKAIFDLTGRKVSKASKGLYIINGKKVLVK